MKNLTFSNANAKLAAMAKRLKKRLKAFTLPSGYTCPSARDCLSKANRETGKIEDGPHTEFRCFAASSESQYKNTREMVWRNLDVLKAAGNDAMRLAGVINSSLPKADIIRIHVGGDFYSQTYFDAWIQVAKLNPDTHFYAYTKSLNFWTKRLDVIPDNFVLTASRGGKHDHLIDLLDLKCAEVVYSEAQAAEKGLEIDHDDYHAAFGTESFALLIHGTQPKGSNASKALQTLKKKGWNGYSKRAELASA